MAANKIRLEPKMAAFELVRINTELLPLAHSILSSWLIKVGVIQMIYGALS